MPRGGASSLYLDHVAHFVPRQEPCRGALEQLGFRPAPFSLQRHRAQPGAPLLPVGTGNHCVMLEHGYLEFLVPLAETEVANQLRALIARHVGAHSIVFGTDDAAKAHARLQREGFDPLPAIALERPIETLDGESVARFTVVRVAPGAMAEGRIQFCQHHTAPLLWQERWLSHPNGARGLAGVWVAVQDLQEAVARYTRFTGREAAVVGAGVALLETERGWIRFCEPAALEREVGMRAPHLPLIAACLLSTRDLHVTRTLLERNGLEVRTLDCGRIAVRGPAAVGGEFVFEAG